MPLCNICKSISFEDLPPFPEEGYEKTTTGFRYIHSLFPNSKLTEAQSLGTVKYHGSILDLQRAAADGCELCQLIRDQTDALLAEFDSLDYHQRVLEYSPPTFDMWLTKRPEGGNGFWVLSSCHGKFEDEPPATLPIAAIAFGASENDPLAAKFRGRPIRTAPDAEAFSQVKSWIADCDANHQCCSQTATLPDTLLDVGSSVSEGSVMIVHLGDGARGSYTALSYPHERGIKSYDVGQAKGQCASSLVNMTTLPQLFQDAIRLTHDLGIKYLWIDAICISEDRGGNFERDSAAFGSIFANATLTLAATGCRSDSEGLFFHRTARSFIRIPHSVSEGTTGDLWMQVLPLNKEVLRLPYIEMKSEPLWSGAWAFQERVLSPRILHFASDQIYFECMEHFVSEDGLLLDNRYHTVHNIDRDTGLLHWFELIWTYGQCDLADASDKLPALSNIARSYQVILEDEYVAGFWKKSLVECLCWQSVECKPAGLYRAPSWSWASVDGIVGMGFHMPTWESFATIHNVHLQLDGPNPLGKIREAGIDLEAPLVPLTLAETQGATGDIFLRTKEGSEVGFYAGFDTIPRAYAASAELVQSMELFAVVLAETRMLDCSPEECGNSPCYHGIIVAPVDSRTEEMKRVGFFVAGPEDLSLASVSSHNKTVTIV